MAAKNVFLVFFLTTIGCLNIRSCRLLLTHFQFLSFHLYSNSNLHRQAIDMVCNLLASHDADDRFTDPDCRMRVASLYIPLLTVVMEALPQLNCR